MRDNIRPRRTSGGPGGATRSEARGGRQPGDPRQHQRAHRPVPSTA